MKDKVKPIMIQFVGYCGDFYEGCPICKKPITHKWKTIGDFKSVEVPTHCEN